MLRLFIAADTPSSILPRLAAVRDELRTVRADVKWEPDEKLHCTLKFLGDTQESLVPDIRTALKEISRSTQQITLIYAGLGTFPLRSEPRIVWAGLQDPDGKLTTLATAVDERLSALGFRREERRFHPHVTLGRVKSGKGIRELLAMAESLTLDCPPVSLRTIELMKSDLKPGGSVYTPVAAFELGPGP